ncbi:MAG: cation:dicarboxylase symporter family transporter [Anaerolineaceae bacterium]|nr:cation:dicarboxylase symporter family transporter [Anaerolineaceae bacterium]
MLEMASHLRRVIIRVTLKGLSYDPLAGSAELSEEEIMMHSIMSQMKTTPRWEYTLGNNVINYVIRKKQSSYWLALVTAIAALIIFHTLLVWLRTRIPPLTLWKKCFSTFLIALTTGSSSAAFQDNVNTCTEKFGISKKCAYFGVSFGQVFYNTGISIMLWCGAIVTAERCGIDFSPTWIATAMILIFGLALAAPPVAGGGAASFSILFAQLGLPLSDLAVILALYNILDFLNTAVKVFGIQCVVLAADFRNN